MSDIQDTPLPPVDPPVVDPPVDPPTDDDTSSHSTEDECEQEDCVPQFVPMTVELAPKITICVDKPLIHLKNNAVCKCKPCKKKKSS